mmetsp:Transcript_18639/g.53754  ORF Transcript_18639/g.53754 Transcript_18639/m.53754 type:complete len:80 (-) Transcript_18639:68-307(-)
MECVVGTKQELCHTESVFGRYINATVEQNVHFRSQNISTVLPIAALRGYQPGNCMHPVPFSNSNRNNNTVTSDRYATFD